MRSVKSFKSVFCRRNPDRVYVMEDTRKPQNLLTRCMKALGFKPMERKYNPDEFNHRSDPSFSDELTASQNKIVPNCNILLDTDESEDDLELDIIDLEVEVPRDESLGDQEEPLPMVIAFEYPEEEMPVWFHLGYGCDPPEVEFSWLRFFGFRSDHFV